MSLSPDAVKKINGWLAWFWLANFPPVIYAYITWDAQFQKRMLLYLALVSIWANVGTHFGAWIAARVEVDVEVSNDDV